LHAQQDEQESKNGKSLPVSGTIRVLLVYAEIDYDVNQSINPDVSPNGSEGWPKGQLPVWKDDMFDPYPSNTPTGSLTKYFYEMSFGGYLVIGDYVDEVITIKQSETKDIKPWGSMNRIVLQKLSAKGELKTRMGFGIDDFDLWTMHKQGHPKETPSIDDPRKIDHLMVIYRNIISVPPGNGRASPGSAGLLCGYHSDSYSVFGANNNKPFNISKHEYAHLMIGDNNFHVGGGQSGGVNYFISTQGGWSILGAANSSLLTCNAWDRDRFNWVGPGKMMNISCVNAAGTEISTDLDAEKKYHQGRYIIRDFVTSGDAIKIKIPFLGEKEFPQWLWIENHQTVKNNGSDFDQFQYQDAECVEDAVPGLYCYMQVDKNTKKGRRTYSGYGDYLRPMPADGMFDINIIDEKLANDCVNQVEYEIFERKTNMANPFSGNHLLEFPVMDLDDDDKITAREQKAMVIERVNGKIKKRLPYLGHADMAFHLNGKKRIGIETNPSTASMNTLVSSSSALTLRYNEQRGTLLNNRKIMLNGISVSIVEERPDGSIVVDIDFEDYNISQDVRWCADSIALPADKKLEVLPGKTLLIDRSYTATRLWGPKDYNGKKAFSSPTTFILEKGATLVLNEDAKLILANGSKLEMREGSKLILNKNARLLSNSECKLTLKQGAKIVLQKKAKAIINSQDDLVLPDESAID
ncbi:MAG: hypothetical protein HKN22_02365, partial [Bacteroidia bacterium]|nr:hypothetical protein [Bacteroidia bacterium]